MNYHRLLWLQDFTPVPVEILRPARYALQLLLDDAKLRIRLNDRSDYFSGPDDGLIGYLWQLVVPLFHPKALQKILATVKRDDEEEHDNAEVIYLDPMGPDRGMRERVKFFKTLPKSILERLTKSDNNDPVSTTIPVIGEALGLNQAEMRLLDFLDQCIMIDPLRNILNNCERVSARINRTRLAAMVSLDEATLDNILSRSAPLRSLGLVQCDFEYSDLDGFMRPTNMLHEILNAAPKTIDDFRSLLIEPAPKACWALEEFPHLTAENKRLQAIISKSVETGAVGVNALFYGPPGTGKTEMARALATASGLTAYQVRSTDEDGDALRHGGRLSAYLMAQRVLVKNTNTMLIFDEVEDVFRGLEYQKGRMNRILEENQVPAIWITNGIDDMDPAFLRRFLLPVAFETPPRSVRRQMAERHLGDCNLAPSLLDELAADAALAPAQLGAARRLLDLFPNAPAEKTVREVVAAIRTLLHGSPAPRKQRTQVTKFDVAYLNLAGNITPSAIAQALSKQGRGSLCFYGPPGTGKTAFAEVLAEALDRELVASQASDLISPYVGETEQNLARLFRECDPAHTVLLLDEVDSFLNARSQARHSWERTQVNELLQQMERFSGIFIAATNMIAGIDTAAMRRFDFKLNFRTLKPVQRISLFAREALGNETATVPLELARQLETLNNLTPGDFATVCRQRTILGETFTPEQFVRMLATECRFKQAEEARTIQ